MVRWLVNSLQDCQFIIHIQYSFVEELIYQYSVPIKYRLQDSTNLWKCLIVYTCMYVCYMFSHYTYTHTLFVLVCVRDILIICYGRVRSPKIMDDFHFASIPSDIVRFIQLHLYTSDKSYPGDRIGYDIPFWCVLFLVVKLKLYPILSISYLYGNDDKLNEVRI